jgi:phenylalanyl-tRNA synthetase beta chain
MTAAVANDNPFDTPTPATRVSLRMKISLEWLREFTPGDIDAQSAADALTAGGLNVESVEGSGDQAVLDVEVTSNRGDCLCHLGIAREAAALMNRKFAGLNLSLADDAAASPVAVSIESPACPHYTARLIRGVRIAPSPPHILHRLAAVGLRPINNVVDVTNYVLMEMGQPLHAFDFAHVGGGKIVVRQARGGEKLTTLDGRAQMLADSMLVIADASRPLALAGIMGGESSQVTGATVDVLLESARFDPLSVRRTSRALALRSESSFRFERGLDPTLPARASLRAAQLILETAGGRLDGGLASAGSENYQPRTLELRLARLNALLGFTLPPDEVVAVLSRLHLSPVLSGETVQVQVPSWRLDLNIEADLIEEVARMIGFDKIPVRPEISVRLQPTDATATVLQTLRQTLIAGGFFEAVTFSFVSDRLKQDFFPPGAKALMADAAVRKADATLRPSLLPGLLEAVRHNETVGTAGAALFEIGSAFQAAAGRPDEHRKLALISGGDWRALRGIVEALLLKLDAEKPMRFLPAEHAGFAAGACAAVEWNGKPIGFAGQIAQATAAKLSLHHSPMACELDLKSLLDNARAIPRLRPMPSFPAARRDLSLIVEEKHAYAAIEHALRCSAPPYLVDIEYVTTFRGKPLEAGTKSVSVTLVFRSDTGTLTSEQVEASVAVAFAAAAKELGATLRQ